MINERHSETIDKQSTLIVEQSMAIGKQTVLIQQLQKETEVGFQYLQVICCNGDRNNYNTKMIHVGGSCVIFIKNHDQLIT